VQESDAGRRWRTRIEPCVGDSDKYVPSRFRQELAVA
jgi:hypothetical protein